MFNNRPRVVVTDLGGTTLVSQVVQVVISTTHQCVHEHAHIIHVQACALVMNIPLFNIMVIVRT